MRVPAAWYRWRDIYCLLINKTVILKNRARVTMRVLDLCCCMALNGGQ